MDIEETTAEILTDDSNSEESSSNVANLITCDDKESSIYREIDIVNRLTIYEENDEQLSEVMEESEEDHFSEVVKNATFQDDRTDVGLSRENTNTIDRNSVVITNLRDRISSLNASVLSLRNELSVELSLWKKERDEYQRIQEKTDLIAIEEATAAARAAAEAYAAESPLSNELNAVQYNCCSEILDVNPEQTLSELTILEYEKKLAKYQDSLAFSQAEKRYNMRRQLAANTYRQKLIEVERLCDEELAKIKENANSLKPLKKIISQWYSDDRCCAGDGDEPPFDDHYKSFATDNYSRTQFCYVGNTRGNFQTEVNMAPEIYSAKFNVDQIRDDRSHDDIITKNEKLVRSTGNDRDEKFLPESVDPIIPMLRWESSNCALSTSL